MRLSRVFGLIAAATLLLSAQQAFAVDPWGLNPGKVELKSAGPLAFGPEGILFVGDPTAGSIVAIATDDAKSAAPKDNIKITGFQQKLDDWLFDNQRSLTRDVVKQAAKEQAGIGDFDARYESALQEVRTDASLGGLLQVRFTPTIYLNGRMIAGNGAGLPAAQYVDALIDIELKKSK